MGTLALDCGIWGARIRPPGGARGQRDHWHVNNGIRTFGDRRQYIGNSAEIERSQVSLHLVYPRRRAHTAVNREVHVPRAWAGDANRPRDAGAGPDTAFATKLEAVASHLHTLRRSPARSR
ncbi:transposase [Streptomyces lydicus]|uniref:transposase n=1 Tax=Streptomyces lydicus TaxID=47763 RepID=UPI0035BE5901